MFLQNNEVKGQRKPFGEWRFHRDIFKKRPEYNGVIHNHSLYATSIAITKEIIPAHHYMVAVSGGTEIRRADYATFGTPKLLEGRNLLSGQSWNCGGRKNFKKYFCLIIGDQKSGKAKSIVGRLFCQKKK